jgi:hypothetical protein
MAKIDIKKIKASYGTDLEAEVEGKWFSLMLIDGVKVKVARINNPNYKKAFTRLYKPYVKQTMRGSSIDQAIQERIQTDLLIDTLLKDWSGMPGENGVEVPYSKELARELVTDPELRELRDEILGFAEEFEAYQKEIVEELEKN